MLILMPLGTLPYFDASNVPDATIFWQTPQA
jgi:hypothetical protein